MRADEATSSEGGPSGERANDFGRIPDQQCFWFTEENEKMGPEN